MTKGRFFTFEGIDGCGKSSQAALCAGRLSDAGYGVIATREPGGTPIAEKIRNLLLDPTNNNMADECELLLYLAARAQHVREKIIPAIESGAVVICDRFQFATYAYQGFGRNLPLDVLQRMNGFATGGIDPDITFIFDIPVEVAASRMAAMNKQKDRLEAGGKVFFERIREGYRELATRNPASVILLDGTLPIEVLADLVSSHVRQKMKDCAF